MKKDVLTQLYKEHASIIYRYLLKHNCRREVAEELVQESFVR
jgi:DNA-directed RNA polymerase specialized sigma24 family protein